MTYTVVVRVEHGYKVEVEAETPEVAERAVLANWGTVFHQSAIPDMRPSGDYAVRVISVSPVRG